MKRFIYSVIFAAFVAGFAGSFVSLVGCKATPNTIAYKSVASLELGVETGLKVWVRYVVKRRAEIAALSAGVAKDTQSALLDSQEGQAIKALEVFKRASLALRNSLPATIDPNSVPATGDIIDGSTSFLTLTKQFSH